MNLGMVPLSFAAGIATFFNPCGFALLPAYVSHYIGKEGGLDMPWSERAWRGLSLGLVT
ncbi:MAG TPA: cytochrome C biogenesis protein, partial [Candidatus Fraserbacteria bacterium]|nr:cytochrome C biogenesis protein [Candidatus Fraserbacteria bacterium]